MSSKRYLDDQDLSIIHVFDLTHPTTWSSVKDYYGAIEKNWKICVNCGIPGLGTGIHLEHAGASGSMQPAIIPSEYLITRLEIVDVSYLSKQDLNFVLTLDVALQWTTLKYDPREPTLVLFKFGWTDTNQNRKCVCKIPGLSYELAEWIAANLSHVVGVATDAPTLESDQTRELTARTVSNVLGKSGVYMIENVNIRRRLPERGCMTIAMPLKLLEASYVPTRLTALCPPRHSDRRVSVALKKQTQTHSASRDEDVDLNEIFN
ncbi:uncharacterized protein LOC123657476 [Melitaea cinxia]|uniref:uncharacterized protein LOC123657476 n=1 Tax=Melitaea cinxia TaxID=113334 RepID=UPI001E271FEE|nr:uncharacterized protein LOC123657476 [Melitaea cinxia]